MNTHTDKKQENKNEAAAGNIAAKQKLVSPTFQLKSNRPETIAQNQIKISANNSPQVNQLRKLQAIADNRTTIKQLKPVQTNNAPGIIQFHLADDLTGKKINVVIAGESHGEIPEDQEMGAWGKAGIKVHYEADKIPNGKDGKVTPDPIKLRLAFGYTALNEYVSPFLEKSFKPGKTVDSSGVGNAAEVLDYLLPVLINDLKQAPESQASKVLPMITVLKELRSLLRNNTLTKVQTEELERRVLVSKVKRDLELIGDFIGGLHSDSPFKEVPFKSFPLQVARSQQMLDRINKASGSLENIIYKVGNLHVVDMRREKWEQGPKVAVYEKTEYINEYKTIPVKPTATVLLPPQSQSLSSVPKSVPKSPAITAVPIQPPKREPVSSVKEVPKNILPLQPPKSQPVSSVKEVPKNIVPIQPPKNQPVSSGPKLVPVTKTTKVVKSKEPEKSAADLKVEQLQGLLNSAPEKVKTAKGFLELQQVLGHYKIRMSSEDIIDHVKRITKERNERFSITKLLVRSSETQKLYDDIDNALGG